jgi:hypothetical protein
MFKNLLLRLILFFGFFVLAGCTMPEVSIASTNAPATATPTAHPAETLTPILQPLVNTVYLGTFNGEDAIFNTSSDLQKYFENGIEESSPLIGELTLSENVEHIQPFDFRNLENPQQLASLQGRLAGPANFIFDRSREQLYISLIFHDDAVPMGRNSIYRMVLATHEYQEVWKNEVGTPNKYGENYLGNAILTQVKGNYLVMGIYPCYACDGTSSPSDIVLLNINTRAERVLGTIGNVSIDLAMNKVSYQNLVETKAVCGDPSPVCNDGYQLIYTPAGDVIEESLP